MTGAELDTININIVIEVLDQFSSIKVSSNQDPFTFYFSKYIYQPLTIKYTTKATKTTVIYAIL